jgi:hypothetical protein
MIRYRRLPSGTVATLGDVGLFLLDANGALPDLTSGHTFSLTILNGEGDPWFTAKTTGITGAAGNLDASPQVPNIAVAWAATGELQAITIDGSYLLVCEVLRTADGKRRWAEALIEIFS